MWRTWWLSSMLIWLIGFCLIALAQPQTVTAIRFQGSQPDGSTTLPEQELLSVMQSRVGSLFSEETIRSDSEAIQRLYEERGYPLARVVGFDYQADGTLFIKIAEGIINDVRVVGNKRTRAGTILREIRQRPGEVYSLPKMQEDLNRLGRMSYLKEAQIVPEPTDELGQVLLNIKVAEQNTTQFAAAVGYTSRRGLLGYLELSDINLLGGGQNLQLRWQRGTFYYDGGPEDGEQRQAYQLNYIDPGVGNLKLYLGFSAYDQQSVFRPTFFQSDLTLRNFERRRGFTIFLGRQWNDRLLTLATFRRDDVNYDDAPPFLISFGQQLISRGRVVAPGLRVIYDSRDNRLNPRQGIRFSGAWESAQRAWGGDFTFDRVTLDLSSYWRAPRQSIIALRALAGAASDELPLSESFWLGGFDLRGYEFDEFRGNRMVLLSGEWRVPVMEGIQGVLFADAGDAWHGSNSPRLNLGAGAGVRFLTPFGSIRLDVAAGRRKVFTYVTLGQTF